MAVAPELDRLHVEVTAMRRRHVRSVLRIETQVYPRPWTASLFMSELALRNTRAYFVARVGRTVVGYAGLMLAVDEAHVTTIAVDPEWHRNGIATRLLATLGKVAIEENARALTLEVRMSNIGAQALYRRFGFTPAGVRKGYYADTKEDAIVMWTEEIRTDEYRDLLDRLLARVPGTTSIEGGR